MPNLVEVNFLAHFYLSQSDEELIAGNFLGDFVKGKAYEEFDLKVQHGILLHRHIDNEMDTSDMHDEVKEIVRPYCGKFTGVALDLLYDYFLATSWEDHSTMSLVGFESFIHEVLNDHRDLMNRNALFTMDAMIRGKWLSRYATLEGFERSCSGLASRISAPSGLEHLPALLVEHKSPFAFEFQRFFPVMVWSCFKKYASFART